MYFEQYTLNKERNVTLTAYIQEVEGTYRLLKKRPGIIVIPGGAYQYCSRREADPVASAFLKAGYQTFILRYSVGEFAAWPNPLNDYEQAMSLILSKEEEWHLIPDRIAAAGFSAGGHLAAAAAALSVHKPRAAILGYAVLNDDVKRYNQTAPDLTAAVSKDTCPCFLFASRTDDSVPVGNTIRFVNALEAAGVVYECHIYSHGPHGFSTGEGQIQDRSVMCRRAYRWVEDAVTWLEDVMGGLNNGELTEGILQ